MSILRLVLVVVVISASSLCAQIAQEDSNQETNIQGDNVRTVFSLANPMNSTAGVVHDWMPRSSSENEFSLGPSVAPQPASLAVARFDLNLSLSLLPASQASPAPASQRPPKAFEYSDGYILRNKIHKYAGIAMLPLFAAEAVVGQKLYTGGESESLRSIHTGLATGIGGLFAANAVLGSWNLWEARKDPNGRTKRIIHAILMLGASAGFAATAALAPDDDDSEEGDGSSGNRRSLHRNMAFGSMGAATAGYVLMLLTK